MADDEDELSPVTQASSTLEAVNVLLRSIGQAPTATLLDGGMDADVEEAFAAVQEVSRECQAEGWNFNTEDDFPLSPTTEGEIVLPANTLKVGAAATGLYPPSTAVTMRGLRLLNLDEKSFVFTGPISLTLTLLLPFDELPEYARQFITMRAARRFSDRKLASTAVHEFTLSDEQQARVKLEREDHSLGRHSLEFDNPHFTKHLRRDRPPRSYG